jgi:Domain of unknown function (DUF4349)
MNRNRKIFGLIVLGAVAAMLMASCSSGNAVDSSAAPPSDRGPAETAPQLAPDTFKSVADTLPAGSTAGSAAGTNAATNSAPNGGTSPSLPSELDRKVISNTALTLNVGDVGAAFNQAGQLARSNGGYTEKSSYNNQDSTNVSQRSATLTLRVPATHYDDLLGALRGMNGAKVANESAKSTEITEQYTDLQSRLRNLERTEQSYLTLLQQAKSIQDILTVNDRLDSVRGQIEQIQGRLNVYDNLSDLATIDLTLTPIAPAKAQAPSTGSKSVQEAFADAWQWSLQRAHYAAAAGAVLAVGALWLAVPLLIVFGAARLMRRRGHASAA